MPKLPPHPYFAWLLRMWQEPGETAWRITLQDAHTQEQRGFGTLAELIRFLNDRIREEPDVKTP